jgi:fermentation-respiration switch protein FrsA (DUF1100 family)
MADAGAPGGFLRDLDVLYITETNRIHLVLFAMHNRNFGPYLTAIHSIGVPVMTRWCASARILQKLATLAAKNRWNETRHILVGADFPGSYGDHMATSRFCAVIAGDGWSSRMTEAMAHGCLPVIIMDGVHQAFESILEYSAFAVRIATCLDLKVDRQTDGRTDRQTDGQTDRHGRRAPGL